MVKLVNRAKMTTSTTGSGTITLGSASDGYQTFADAGVSNSDVVRFVIEDGDAWELSSGTYTASGTTLTRTLGESSTGSLLNLTGNAVVFITAAAADIGGSSTGVEFDDNVKVKFGSSGGNELEIYTDGTSSFITESGSDDLNIQGHEINIKNASGTKLLAMNASQVELFQSGNKKLETTPTGVQTTGTVNVNNAYTLPTSDGSANYVLTTNGSGVASWAASGGGDPDLYASNPSSATNPTATGSNSVAIGSDAQATATNGSIAFGTSTRASGNANAAIGFQSNSSGVGALSIGYYANAAADFSTAVGRNAKTATGSSATAIGQAYASGTDSLAAAISTNSSSYGATGSGAAAVMNWAKASSSNSGAFGFGANATNSMAYAFGAQTYATGNSSVSLGRNSLASATYSICIGNAGQNNIQSSIKFSKSQHANQGDAQIGLYPLLADTTDATATAMVTNHQSTPTAGTANQIVLPNNSAYAFSGTIVARQKASEGTASAAWKVEGLIRREGSAGTTVLVNSATTVLDNTPNWGMALSADTTNGGLKVQVTGAASTNIRWTTSITTSELTYA